MQLEAFKYYYIPMKDVGVAGIVAKPTPELIKLQADVVAAVSPFTVETGDSAAFVTTPDDPIIDPALIDYVSTFVPNGSGERFNPHVTTGVAPKDDLDRMLAEPFEFLHLLARRRRRLPTWPIRHGGEETEGTGREALRGRAQDRGAASGQRADRRKSSYWSVRFPREGSRGFPAPLACER